MGIKNMEVRKFKGGLSRVMIIPNPRVTAEVDRGSMNIGSKNVESLFEILQSAKRIKSAAQRPVISAITRAVPANKKENLTA